MQTVSVHEAKTHLSRLLKRVEAGEEITITSSGKPVATLRPLAVMAPRRADLLKNGFHLPDDFDLLEIPDGDADDPLLRP